MLLCQLTRAEKLACLISLLFVLSCSMNVLNVVLLTPEAFSTVIFYRKNFKDFVRQKDLSGCVVPFQSNLCNWEM